MNTASEHKRVSDETVSPWAATLFGALAWPALYACATLMSILREGHCQARPTLCMDEYWVYFYIADGSPFQARGLLSEITRFVWPDNVNIIKLNLIALGICAVVTIACVLMLHRASKAVWARAGIVVLCASPLISVIFEVAGDPLLIAAIVFACTACALTHVQNVVLRGALIVAVSAFSIMIHEASIFLLMPVLALMLATKGRPTFATYATTAVLGIALTLPVVLDTRMLVVDPNYRAWDPISGQLIVQGLTPFFAYDGHWQQELVRNFGSLSGFTDFVLKFPRTWFIPLLGLSLVSLLVFKGERSRLLWRDWLFLTVCSAPLYAIAHDWGRFSAVTFWAAILTSLLRTHADQTPAASDPLSRLAPLHNPEPPVLFAALAALILAAQGVDPDYRWAGMPLASLLVLLPAVMLYGAWFRWSRERLDA